MALVGRKHSSDDTFERVLEQFYDRTVRIVIVWNCHVTYKAANINIHRYSRVVRDAG